MNSTTMEISIALDLLQEGIMVLLHEQDHPAYMGIVFDLLTTVGALTNEYGPEYFTDDEIDIVEETISTCINALYYYNNSHNMENE